jgi:hypothetical protein
MTDSTKESEKVLMECIGLQERKSRDYQNPNSTVKQAHHYRRGIDTIHDMLQQKLYRAQSLIESEELPNHESLEDTYKDLINYASFAVSYLRGQMEGQDPNRDIFNRVKKKVDNYNESVGEEVATSSNVESFAAQIKTVK